MGFTGVAAILSGEKQLRGWSLHLRGQLHPSRDVLGRLDVRAVGTCCRDGAGAEDGAAGLLPANSSLTNPCQDAAEPGVGHTAGGRRPG